MARLFTDREIRAAVFFLPLALLVVLLIIFARERPFERPQEEVDEAPVAAPVLRDFDPNTVDYETLRAMGLTRAEAVSLLHFRAAGKVFRIPEDVAVCYGISDSLYDTLRHYIHIDPRFAFPRRRDTVRQHRTYREQRPLLQVDTFRLDTVTAAYLRAIGALTKRQAEVFIRWRDLHGIYDMEELRECYTVSDSVATALEPFIIFPERPVAQHRIDTLPLEINRADSAQLVALYGIGALTAGRIIHYRNRLGGFYRIEQLAEVPGVTMRNYDRILSQISCKYCEINKIGINFAPSEVLAKHPYISPAALRKILKTRALKGGWSSAQEMIDDHILKPAEAERLAPYLDFSQGGTKQQP